ncbi:molybdate ABC transporter substrate-binding protein [Jeotgalibacillus salarius]|uniref:Molybdate ABC transporter substrate-binding protein n=1 Tax=Jeotgalibacillus salarius TaxID=546023 RepID=A0A4Y8LHS1_9BACL|nr:molybdate ABC transporter substrate-binding protein [Jeotgalibacillus salarius]TFE02284.1 molybdate ABC transporter substrate-binding protein [Jeotgalibacillus salarius]
MKKWLLGLGVLVISGCSATQQEDESTELTVSAAASLQDALYTIETQFEEETGIGVTFNFGGSGSLQQQISQGAPVDLFISANETQFNELIEEGVISEEDSTSLIGNELVMIVPRADLDIATFEDLTDVERISIGTPETVPAGEYSKEVLEHLELWSDFEEQIVYAKDVRQVLSYVESENVNAGMVYYTDALTSDQVKIAAFTEEDWHQPIVYPAGILEDATHSEDAAAFLDYLQSDDALAVFEELGFKGLN